MAEFRMPSLGADMDEGTLVEWRVAVGDHVERGDIVAAVDTDKSTIDVEVFESGTVTALLVAPGDTVPVGTALATIVTAGSVTTTADIAPTPTTTPVGPAADDTDDPTTVEPVDATGSPGVRRLPSTPSPPPVDPATRPTHALVTSPLVRHRADELGVDMEVISGTGPGGTVTRADVVSAAMASPATTPHQRGADGRPSVDPAGHRDHPHQRPDHGLRVPASPLARHRAAEAGLDIADLIGTGPGGAVVAADVQDAAAHRRASTEPGAPTDHRTTSHPAGPAAPDGHRTTSHPAGPAAGPVGGADDGAVRRPEARSRPVTVDRRASLRRAVGDLMARSARQIPHYHLTTQIDMGPASAWLAEHNVERPAAERVLPAALLLRAVVLACADAPDLNGHWVDDALQRSDAVHLGVAVSLRGGGLVAPAVRDAQALDLDGIMSRLRDLVTRVRTGSLRASEMSDPTITVTNLGDSGVDAVHGVIFPPQVALVGFGRIAERPWARDGMLGVHPIVTATLAADHRATDGRDGARFLAAVEKHLQQPEDM